MARTGDDGSEVFSEQGIEFSDIGLPLAVTSCLARAGFSRPTSVQADASPDILAGDDVVMLAETGSGKTVAYLAPALASIVLEFGRSGTPPSGQSASGSFLASSSGNICDTDNLLGSALERCDKPPVLILTATQELVMQVCHVIRDVFPEALPHVRPAYGNVAPHKHDRCAVVVATPRAAVEAVPAAVLESVRLVVVDEADLLLAGAYSDDVTGRDGILTRLRNRPTHGEPQVVFCAATLPERGKRSVGAIVDRLYPHATQIRSAGVHRPRTHVSVAWFQVSVDEVRFSAERASRIALGAVDATGAELSAVDASSVQIAMEGLQQQREEQVWERKLWAAMHAIARRAGTEAETASPVAEVEPVGQSSAERADWEVLGVDGVDDEASVGARWRSEAAASSAALVPLPDPQTVATTMVQRRGLGDSLAARVAPTLVFVSSASRAMAAVDFFRHYGE